MNKKPLLSVKVFAALVLLAAPAIPTYALTVQVLNPEFHVNSSPLQLRIQDNPESPISGSVRDSDGNKIKMLQPVSERDYVWGGRDQQGRTVKPGLYYLELESRFQLWTAVIPVAP